MPHINNLTPMADKPGVIAQSEVNATYREAYDGLSGILYSFFQDNGLLYVPLAFQERKGRYNNSVFNPLDRTIEYERDKEGYIINQKTQMNEIPVSRIAIELLGTKRKVQREDWDFEYTPFVAETHRFGVYFNAGRDSFPQRNSFIHYAFRLGLVGRIS